MKNKDALRATWSLTLRVTVWPCFIFESFLLRFVPSPSVLMVDTAAEPRISHVVLIEPLLSITNTIWDLPAVAKLGVEVLAVEVEVVVGMAVEVAMVEAVLVVVVVVVLRFKFSSLYRKVSYMLNFTQSTVNMNKQNAEWGKRDGSEVERERERERDQGSSITWLIVAVGWLEWSHQQ